MRWDFSTSNISLGLVYECNKDVQCALDTIKCTVNDFMKKVRKTSKYTYQAHLILQEFKIWIRDVSVIYLVWYLHHYVIIDMG